MFLDLQPLWPSPLTKPDLLTFSCSSGHVLSKTKSVTPHFFIFLTSLTHHLSMVNFLEKIKVLKKRVRTGLRARVRVGPVLACSRSRIGPGVHMLAYSRTRLLTCSYARLIACPCPACPRAHVLVPTFIGTLRKTRRQRQRESQKTIGLKTKTVAVHVLYNSLYIFFAVLCKTAT